MQILEIQLLSTDLAKTEEFYHHVLGLPLVQSAANSISFLMGTSKIVFLKSEGKTPIYHFTFHIPKNQLLEGMDWVAQKTEIILNDEQEKITDFENWNAKSFYFFDYNGNILECIVRFDLQNESSAAFSVESLLGISEMGIGTDNVLELVARLRTEADIPLFSKQVQRENFHALGDDEGLFVISRTDRNWYPTQIPVEKFYTKIILTENGTKYELEVNK
jgi:catechol 2,3-dioxygenase-like lactoylglutathione lyase family enzyme